MKNTRFMDRLFSAVENGEEELTDQVAADIEAARESGEVDTDEVSYMSNGNGDVEILDKGTGEVTVAERALDEEGTYDLYPANVDVQLEGYLHPEGDGVTPGQQRGGEMENVMYHTGGVPMSDCIPPTCLEEKEFSVLTENTVVQKIFSDQEFCERIFSEVIESEQTANVGDLKIEKDPEDEYTVIVTSEATGDQARVELGDEEMEVTELESKNFSHEEQYMPLYVVGIDVDNHVIVDAPVHDEESAQDLVHRLTEKGVQGVQVFETPEESRDYAFQLLGSLGVESEEDLEEPEQVEFSAHDVFVTRFYSNSTQAMERFFSEAIEDIDASQDEIEDAIESGEEIENETEIITPVDAITAIIEDKETGEFTKVILDGDEMDLTPISEEEAEELIEDLSVEDKGSAEEEVEKAYAALEEERLYSEMLEEELLEERAYSDIHCNDEETRFFSASEEFTSYMERLFSEEADQDEIEDAIESGEEIENETEIITPVDATTAVIEDKETGEFTKATLDGEEMDVVAISEEEAEELVEDLAIDEESEKDFSVYSDDEETRFFSASEEFTSYMERLFSEEADQDEIEDAIESGEQIENEEEVITPIDATTAIIEDKETGEFTKATLDGEEMDVVAISEEEADELTEDLAVEDEEVTAEVEEAEKKFSTLSKFFAETVEGEEVQEEDDEEKPSVEVIEDKALAAIQSIQEATQEAQQAIMEAKEAPVEAPEGDLKEARFSDFSENQGSTILTWLDGNLRK